MRVLVLNADYAPLKVTSWERAVGMIIDGVANGLEAYPGEPIRSAGRGPDREGMLEIPRPAVVALRKYKSPKGRVKFNSRNVVLRDRACCYCGAVPKTPKGTLDFSVLTFDHVIPKARSQNGKVFSPWRKGWIPVTCWDNAVCACRPCNQLKRDRTPQEAGFKMRWTPRSPTPTDILRISLGKMSSLPDQWRAYLPDHWWQEHTGEDMELDED